MTTHTRLNSAKPATSGSQASDSPTMTHHGFATPCVPTADHAPMTSSVNDFQMATPPLTQDSPTTLVADNVSYDHLEDSLETRTRHDPITNHTRSRHTYRQTRTPTQTIRSAIVGILSDIATILAFSEIHRRDSYSSTPNSHERTNH